MASVQSHDRGLVVRFDGDDWLRGLIPKFDGDTDTAVGDGLSSGFGIDPHRFPGYIGPAYNPQSASNSSVVGGVLREGVLSDGGTAYLISADAEIHTYNVATNTFTTPAFHSISDDLSGHGGHSGFSGEDVAVYSLDGTPYLFYSWNDATDGDIGRYDFSSTFADDYVSASADSGAVLTTGMPHPMIVGADNVLYIGNGNKLASLNGNGSSAGIFNPARLTLPDGFVITSYAETENYLVIFANTTKAGGSAYRAEAKAFFFDYGSEKWTYAYNLPGNKVDGGFTWKGIPGCFVENRAYDASPHKTKLMLYSGGRFDDVLSFTGDAPAKGGVEVTANTITWNGSGTVYRFGAPFGGDNILVPFADLAGTTSGLLKNFFDRTLVASSGTGASSGGLEALSIAQYATARARTALKQIPPSGDQRFQVQYVRVNFKDTLSAGRGLKLALSTDNSSATLNERGTLTYLIDTTDPVEISTISQIFREEYQGNPLPIVSSSLGILIDWGSETPETTGDAAFIESIEVYLEPTAVEDV